MVSYPPQRMVDGESIVERKVSHRVISDTLWTMCQVRRKILRKKWDDRAYARPWLPPLQHYYLPIQRSVFVKRIVQVLVETHQGNIMPYRKYSEKRQGKNDPCQDQHASDVPIRCGSKNIIKKYLPAWALYITYSQEERHIKYAGCLTKSWLKIWIALSATRI